MTPLELAWEEYGGELLGDHGNVKAKCPLHDDSRASARVNIDNQRWTCFAGCGHGDIYELVKLKELVDSFPEQKRIAVQKFGVFTEGERGPGVNKKKTGKPWRPPWLR